MNRTDRLLAIIIAFQARPKQRAEDLAGRFEVSVRTSFRTQGHYPCSPMASVRVGFAQVAARRASSAARRTSSSIEVRLSRVTGTSRVGGTPVPSMKISPSRRKRPSGAWK